VASRRRLLLVVPIVAALAGACSYTAPQIAVQAVPTPTTTAPKPVEYRQLAWAAVPSVPIYTAPNAAAPSASLKNPTAEDQPLAFLAIGRQDDWLQVRLPVRPNGTVGWVKTSDIKLAEVQTYRILVEVAAHRLTLLKGDEVVMQEPVGVGKARTPTPTGRFYIDAMVRLANPNTVWGPFQMSVSGFSNVLERFMGGPGQIAIHGTNTPQLIPGDISNGCVRLKNDAITKLAGLTGIGTPVDIVA
jgi:lipoprotein-anchoring transpeptidase ErfK/SrfK